MTVIEGRLEHFMETGTEGWLYAVQDKNHEHTAKDLVNGLCPWGSPRDHCPVTRGDWGVHARYEGLHVLNPGDHLTILDECNVVLWEGEIPTTDNHAAWVRRGTVEGVDRDVWVRYFSNECRARLVLAEK